MNNKDAETIREFYIMTEINKIKQNEFDQFLDQISPTLKSRAECNIFKKMLDKNGLMQKIKRKVAKNPDVERLLS